MQVWLKRLFALLCGIALLLTPMVFAGAETNDMLYIIGSNRDGGRLKIVMNVVSSDAPDIAQVSASFDGLGIDAFQFYPCENFQPGVSLCIVPDVASASDGRAMRDQCIVVDALLGSMTDGDNACIITTGENALSSDRDALRKQLYSLPVAKGNRYDLLNAALDLLESDASANMRAQIVVLSDGVSNGSMPEELTERINGSRIPVYSVAMLYGTADPERIAQIDELTTVIKGSRGGAAFNAGIRKETLTAAADGIRAAIGSGYVLELDAAAIRKYVNSLGGVCKVTITVGDSTISDTITLGPEDIPLGANDPIGEYALTTPEPETAETSAPPADTAVPAGTPVPTDTAAPIGAAAPTESPATEAPPMPTVLPTETEPASGLTPVDTSVPEALSDGKAGACEWYKALSLLWKILIPVGTFLIIAGIIALLLLRKRRRKGFKRDTPHNSVSLGTTTTIPSKTAHPTSENTTAVQLSIIRLPFDTDSVRYTLTVQNGFTIGSDPAVSQLIIDDDTQLLPANSRIAFQGGRLYIYDLTRTNDAGTALNDGDTVRIGGFRYCVYWNLQ